MLSFPAFSVPFWGLYCWCGLSDMIDGPIAREMKAESTLGSKIDSLADLVFVICSCIQILPAFTLPLWIWLWVEAIGIVKATVICIVSSRRHRLTIPHSLTNKITGFLLFCLPFALIWLDPVLPSILVCAAATLSIKVS